MGVFGVAALGLLGQGCKEATTPFVAPQLGPDSAPPVVQLSPAHDTTVDSTGVLPITVYAHDQSWVTSMQLVIINGPVVYPAISPDTTDALEGFSIGLSTFKHTQFRWFVIASDILNHRTVSDTVTVSVR